MSEWFLCGGIHLETKQHPHGVSTCEYVLPPISPTAFCFHVTCPLFARVCIQLLLLWRRFNVIYSHSESMLLTSVTSWHPCCVLTGVIGAHSKHLSSVNGNTSDRPQIWRLASVRHGEIRWGRSCAKTSELAVTCGHSPDTVLVAAENTTNVMLP